MKPSKDASLFVVIHQALMTPEPAAKKTLIDEIIVRWKQQRLSLDPCPIESIPEPGRPSVPKLVPPRELVKRKISTVEGRACIIHAVAHIEFNAINLALDALYRFQDLSREYYSDWLSVAAEEAYHCSLMIGRLNELGYQYGDFPAHNGLWEMSVKTEHGFLERMGMVPRVFEARGLDVTPAMIKRFVGVGDSETAALLEIILQDEIGHVAIGNRWFEFACEQAGVEVIGTFRKLVDEFMEGGLRGPFHIEARLQAGFSREELDLMEAM